MTDPEKNEVLLKFAGFKDLSKLGTPYPWDAPDGSAVKEPPDFLHSLDAQAKWLWPKLDSPDQFGDKGQLFSVLYSWLLAGDLTPEACASAILSLIGEGDVS